MTKKQNTPDTPKPPRDIAKYFRHLPECNTMQNWNEAIQAMGDTPERAKDIGWHLAYNDMRDKMSTCTCGMKNMIDILCSRQEWRGEIVLPDKEAIDNNMKEVVGTNGLAVQPVLQHHLWLVSEIRRLNPSKK